MIDNPEQYKKNFTIQELQSDAGLTYKEYQELLNKPQNGYVEEQRQALLKAFDYADSHNISTNP